MLLYLALVIFLTCGLFLAEKYRVRELERYAKIEASKAEYLQTIQYYKMSQLYNAGHPPGPQPVSRQDVEQIQNQLMKRMALAKLDTSSITIVAQQVHSQNQKSEAADSVEYEATATGSWDGVLDFLNTLRTEPALITIRALRMEPFQDKIRAQYKYKVYLIQ